MFRNLLVFLTLVSGSSFGQSPDADLTVLVLTARTEEEYKNTYPAFNELVSSYRFLTSDLKIDTK